MKKILLIISALFFLIPCSMSYGFGGCEDDCSKCHSLETKEAQQILLNMKNTTARVAGIKMSPVRGMWEVSVEDRGKRDALYVGFSKRHVVRGTILEVTPPVSKAQEKPAEPKARVIDISKVPLEGSLVLGDKNAAHKVFVFTDPDCPYCAKLHLELKKVIAEGSDIAFYLKLMPLKMHPDAYWKSQSIMCGNSLEMLEDNFEKRQVPRPVCETKVIDENLKLAGELGITGTPTLIMPDGFVMSGGSDAKALRELIMSHTRKTP
ncbi:MAG: DsbC family protein [Nitrospirae bacterium]|nr:DsbC family protein [Nitrospirota bacterium]